MSRKTVQNAKFEDKNMENRDDMESNVEDSIEDFKAMAINSDFLTEAKGEYMTIKAPEYGLEEMRKRIAQAQADKRKDRKRRRMYYGGAAAAVVALFVLGLLLCIF